MKTRKLLKPYGYQPLESYTPEQLVELQKALWGKPEAYLQYDNSPVLSYYNLGQLDNLLCLYLEKNKDITPVISVADWCDSSFRSSRLMKLILSKSQSYNARNSAYIYNMDNAKMLLENFLLYSEDYKAPANEADLRYTKQVYHEVIPEFCEKMIHAYNYFDSVNDTVGKEKAFELFDKTLAMTKKTYGDDKKYCASRACVLVYEVLLTRKNLSLSYPLLKSLLLDVDIPLIWDSYGSMVQNILFKVPLNSDSFKIVEHIFSPVEHLLVKKIKESFSYYNELKHIDKIVYYLEKHWSTVTPEESLLFAQRLFKLNNSNRLEHDLIYLVPLMRHIEPFDKIIKMFDRPTAFTDDIRKTKGFILCREELHKRKLYNKLDETLEQKEPAKLKKI